MRTFLLAAAATLAVMSPAFAASSAPAPGRVNVESLQPKSLLPKSRVRTEFLVEVNKLGQVIRVRSGKSSNDLRFNDQTYGNALQAYIRTPDGKALAGTYRLTYEYDPKTTRVHRSVALVKAGGVNGNAQGAALQMMEIAKRNRGRTPPPGTTPAPAPSVNASRLPDLPQVMKSPGH